MYQKMHKEPATQRASNTKRQQHKEDYIMPACRREEDRNKYFHLWITNVVYTAAWYRVESTKDVTRATNSNTRHRSWL